MKPSFNVGSEIKPKAVVTELTVPPVNQNFLQKQQWISNAKRSNDFKNPSRANASRSERFAHCRSRYYYIKRTTQFYILIDVIKSNKEAR